MFHLEIFKKMTLHAKQSILQSRELSSQQGLLQISPLQLLQAIMLEKGSLGANILTDMQFKKTYFKIPLKSNKKNISDQKNQKNTDLPTFSPQTKQIITRAFGIAGKFNYPYVGTEHLVYALLESADEQILSIARKYELDLTDLESIFSQPSQNQSELSKEFSLPDVTLSKQTEPSKFPMPNIEQFCTNLNKTVTLRDELIIGRDKELDHLLDILGRKIKNNPLLIGDPGVGKTALVLGLAQKINADRVSARLATKTIYALDLALVVAGTTFRGEFENRLKEIIREATENKNVILFIDEIHGIVGTGNSQGALDAANILKPALSSGDVQCIGATTHAEYKKYIEKDPALVRRFQPLQINEPSVRDTVTIMEKTKHFYENFHHVSISKDVITNAVELSVRYINNRFLPDKAIDLIDETASTLANKTKTDQWVKDLKKLERELSIVRAGKDESVQKGAYETAIPLGQKEVVLKQTIANTKEKQLSQKTASMIPLTLIDVAQTVSRNTGIPLEKILPHQDSSSIQGIEAKLNQKIVGQIEAIQSISDALARSHSGIGNPDRPLGSFLFLGPTGVGKTMLAKILSQEIFARPDALIRIDMSEFMEKHNLAQLLGAPTGYVGFEEGGKLTEKVRRNPYSLVLFDEIEKAHPDVSNILLQILEDGALTDAQGVTVNFKNTIIIITSNLGTSDFTQASQVGFQSHAKNTGLEHEFEKIKTEALSQLKKSMRPEIINRLDQVIVFKPLSIQDLQKIAQRELRKIADRLLGQKIKLEFSAKIASFIAKQSIAPESGARLVRKNIQDLIETPIAKNILAGKIRNDKISIGIAGEKLIIGN